MATSRPALLVYALCAVVLTGIRGDEQVACTGETLQLSCPELGSVLVVEQAAYGRKSGSGACGGSDRPMIRPCVLPSSLTIVNDRCFAQHRCEITVSQHEFADPCPGYSKYLQVTYRCVPDSSVVDVCDSAGIPAGTTSGYLASPGYPHPYPPSLDCRLQFDPGPGRAVHLQVLDLELEARQAPGCFDWLIVREKDVAWKKHDYCGNMLTLVEPTILTLEKLDLTFKPDAMNQYRGFLITFTVISYSAPEESVNMPAAIIDKSDHGQPGPPMAGAGQPVAQGPAGFADMLVRGDAPGGAVEASPIDLAGRDNLSQKEMVEYSPKKDADERKRFLAMLREKAAAQAGIGKPAVPGHGGMHPVGQASDRDQGGGCTEEAAREILPLHGVLEHFKANKIFYIRCTSGYKLADEDESVFVCSHGEWAGAGNPECTAYSCPEPATPVHGELQVPDLHHGSQAFYSCLPGFRLVGDATRTCLTSGVWSGITPVCRAARKHSSTKGSDAPVIPFEVPLAMLCTLIFVICKKWLSKIPAGVRTKLV